MQGPDLDTDARFVDLSDEELRIWCTWEQDWFVANYDIESVPGPICPDGSGSVGRTELCVDSFDRLDASCSRTIGDQVRCLRQELAGECPATFPVNEGSPCRWPDDCGIPYPDD
jgi:hypothetical protein